MDFSSYNGYGLEYRTKKRRKVGDPSVFLYTLVYKFYSPKTGLQYILNADYYQNDFFAIKFYCKKYKRSDRKYSITTNKGDLGNILVACLKIIPILLEKYPAASSGIIGANSYDRDSKTWESKVNTQRFRIYCYLALKQIGTLIFTHYQYEEISGYALINNNYGIAVRDKETQLREMFANIGEFSSLFR